MSAAWHRAQRVVGALLTGALAILALPVGAAPAHAAPAPRVAVILMDIDGHLAGRGIAAERRAIWGYLRALPGDVLTGLIIFGDNWRMVVAPTTDRASLQSVLATRKAAGATSDGIYGALAGAQAELRRLGAAGTGRLLVLSDGEELTAQPLTSAVPADVVATYYDSDDYLATLRALARSSGGRLASPAQSAALAAAFPAPSTIIQPAARAAGATPGLPWQLMVVLGIVFLALMTVAWSVVGSVVGGDRRRQIVAEIARYGPRHAPAPAQGGDRAAVRTAVDLTTQLLQSSKTEQGLGQRLDLAGMTRKPGEWFLIGVMVCAVLSAVLTVLTGNLLIGILIGVPSGWLTMRLIVSFRISRRRAAFEAQLPDMLQFIVGALRSGFSLGQALDAAVREDTQPSASEFRRALAEARVGVDLQVALHGVADRMDSLDLRWTVMAIQIQREVGGNLAEVLSTTIGTMRERAFLRRHVRALSAEGRLSAYILIALPLVLGLYLLITDRGYLAPLYTTFLGLVMLFGSLALFVVGVLWMRALVKVEV